MTYRDLLYDVSDHIATITLNRPERLNAISGPMLRSFSAAFRAADGDREVRAIILTGAGRGFCAGLDLKEQGANANEDSINGAGGALPSKFDLADAPPIVLHQTDKPVICALNGAAAGYGLDIALGCDIIVASDAAKLAAVFTKRGVLPESGGTWLLPRLIGWAKAAELAFTGRVLTPEELLTGVWGPEYKAEKEILWVSIARLRQKLETDPHAPKHIVTRSGLGYLMPPTES